MKVKSVLKATSVLLSAIMLVSSAQVGLTAFAAETDGNVAAQETAEPTVSTPVQLLAETQEVTESVAEEPTTQPVTEKQTEAQETTEAEPETTEPTRNSKDPEAVGAKAGDAVGVTSTFNENNGTLHITGSGDMPNYNSPYNVPWYAKRGLITKVVIEDGVTSIGRYAFFGCERLTSVSIADTVTKIESDAFRNCKELKRIDIPDSVTSISSSVFTESGLKAISIPDSVTSLGVYAFQNCSSLESVRMSQNVATLSYQLFYGCSSLESFEIPDSVTSISSSVFKGTAITTLTIPNSVTSISELTDVTVRATIGSYAKLYCDRNGLDFESTVVWNHEGECGENVSYFLDSANCVMTISGSGDIKNYNSAYSMPWELYRDYIKTLVIEDGVTSTGSYAIFGCEKLASVSLPNSMTKIEHSAFQNCKALKRIDIPDSVTSFGNGAFQNCSSLESVRLPQYIKKLSYNLFNGCTSLDSIDIPDSVTSIEGHVFQGCESLKTIEIPANIKQYNDGLFEGCKALTSITIADGVTSIGNSAFRGTGLKAITIPNSVTYIGSNAFENCASLKNVKMSDHVTSFNPGLFSGCTSLEGFEIPNTVTAIGNSVFYNIALKSIKLPDSVISIEAKAFMNCSNLKDISVSKSITSIGSYAFKNCSKLQHFLFPDTLTTIGIGSFHNTPLNEIKLPDSLTFIRGEAFRHCTNLTDVVIPESVTSIEPDAFRECEKLQYILVPETVTNIGARLVADCENVAVIGPMNSAAYDYTVRENVRFLPITGTGDGYAICETGEQYENMTLRFTSSDGDRVYTKILTTDDKNIIYGIDREKTYTAEVCSRNGNVFCSKDNISFGESRSVSVAFENTKAPLDVKVIVVDENGDERDGFTASWSDKNGKYISDSKTLNECIGGEQLSCEIKLGNGLLRNYKAPKKANITVSENSENTVTVTLEKYATYTVSGTVKDSGDETLPNVKVTASQDIGGKTSVYNDVTVENGNYSLTLTEGDYQLTFCKNGYYDKTVNGTLSEDKEENTTLEKLSGSKLGCTVSFNTLSASIQNNLSLNELSVSVFNQTKNKAVNDFTLQNNYFYFKNEDVSQGDTLKFTFADTSGVYEETQQTLTFNEGTFYFAVTMTEKGKVSCKIKNTPNSGNVMLLFDENGKFVDSYRFRNLTLETDHLNAGSYSVVVMGESDPAVSADSLEAFGEYGFTENEDYRVYSAEVKSGELTEIDEIEIPEYNSDKLIYLDPDKTQLSANNTTVAIGQYTVLKAEYSVKEEYTLDAENISLRFAIPENLFMPANGVTLDGLLIGDYTYSDGVLTVNTNKTSGTVRVCLYNILPAEKLNVSAKLYFTINETDRVQPVGSLDLKLSELEFYVPSETRQTNITATGTTFADAEVELFDNGTVVASAQSNKSGEFVIPFELYKQFSKTTHKIWVEVKAPGSVPIRSQVRTVEYDSNMPVLSKVYMSIGMNFWNTREVIIDFLNPSSSTVSYPGDYYGTTITYKVEFLGDVSLLHDVVVLAKIERKGDKPVEIPTVYDEETGMFVGVGKYCGHDFPEELSVSYDSDYSNPLSDMDALIEQYDLDSDYENTAERMQKYIDDDSAYVKMDEDGTKYMKFVEDDAYVEAKMSPDETENTVQMYLFDELIVTDKLTINKAGSAGEAKAALTTKGYNVLTMDTSDCSLLGKLTDNSLCYAMVDGEGNYSELIRTYSDAYIEAIDEIFSNLYDDPAPALNKAAEPVGYDYDRSWIGRVAEFFTGNALVDQFNAYKELKRRYDKCRQNMASIGAQQPDGSVVPYSELLDHGGLLGKDEGGAGIEYWEHEKENAESHLLFQLGLSVLAVTFIGLGLFAVGTGGLVAGIALFSACSLICMAVSEAFKEKSYAEGATEGAVIATGGYSLYKGYKGVNAVPRPQLAISAGVGSLFTGVALVKNSTAIEQSLNNLESIANKCENAYDNRIKYYNPVRLRPLIDPSGYICEAVDSNRVEGVTCTIFYSPNPDGSNAVVWNAEEAGQKNPQLSDSMGHYEWFVPEGYWQVKYEKEGYKTQYSDWLPVPPPQTEVNVAITSLKAPEIKNIYAYQNEIDIEFSQYMNTYTVTDKTVTVSLNGEKVSGKIVPVNAEKGFNNPVISYATKFRFVPDESFSKDDVVTVSVENAANYADNALKAFEDEFEVTLKPESIQADETVTLTMKDTIEIDIQVNPGEAGANQNVSVISGSSLIEILTPSVTTDENGKAKVRVRGVLPGEAEITYQLENSDCTDKTALDIEMPIQKVEPVTASVKSGTTLNKGDKVYLSCATKGAEIYYTTDLSCPCILTSDARIKYTGPIEIKEYTTLIAYAVKDGMEDSRTTLFIYDVAPEPEKLPQVTASVESGSTVDRGTKISLSCDVEGAEIYYTTDMSCPCKTENPARTKYTQPIELNGDSTIIAYAVKDGMEDSKPKLFTYNVEEVLGDADGNGAFTISDVTYLQKYLAGMIEVDNAAAAKWDYNNDGAMNISDATFLQRVLAGLETF